MKSHIKIEEYDGVELVKAESRLREQGYCLVRKKSENNLLPGEYIRQEFSRPTNSFKKEGTGTLRCRVS